MTENSVIKHYKKQLINRQYDPRDLNERREAQNGIYHGVKMYDFSEAEMKKYKVENDAKKTRRKRKNRNCRGQFRHEAMELIKLGANTSNSLYKTKEPYNARPEKYAPPATTKQQTSQKKAENFKQTTQNGVIRNNRKEKTIILEKGPPYQPLQGHTLPQMIPEPERKTREANAAKLLPVMYHPPHLSVPPPDYRVPIHPSPYIPFPPMYRPYPLMPSPPHLHPPPYHLARSPPRPVPRPPVQPVPRPPLQPVPHSPVQPVPRSPVQPVSRPPLQLVPRPPVQSVPRPPVQSVPRPPVQHVPRPPVQPVPRPPVQPVPRPPVQPAPRPPRVVSQSQSPPFGNLQYRNTHPHSQNSAGMEGKCSDLGGRKRKHPSDNKFEHKVKESPQIVAAIDLTVDQNPEREKIVRRNHHKCHCECGKTYTSDPVTQEMIITVPGSRESSEVPTLLHGKIANGVLQLEKETDCKKISKPQQNGASRNCHKVEEINEPVLKRQSENTECSPKSVSPSDVKVPYKLPQLFLIKDLLAKGIRIENKSSHNGVETKVDEKTKNSSNIRPVPTRTEPTRVIVSNHKREELSLRNKSQDYSVSSIIGAKNRRQSVDVDTISISSSSSESVRSPRPKSDVEKLIPQGKLFYYKNNNSFIRYFDDTQKQLFINNIMADGRGCTDDKEVIELPKNMFFSTKDNLTVEEYVNEMTLAERFIPKDFFLFYKFVTGYQICNNNLPVSFLTFLKVYNTNGLKVLLERYVNSLKQTI